MLISVFYQTGAASASYHQTTFQGSPMQFRTEVELPPSPLRLSPYESVAFVGSCFASHIGALMAECLPPKRIAVNPFGTLYNPASILTILEELARPSFQIPKQLSFRANDGLWHHWWCSTIFSASSQETLTSQLQNAWQTAHDLLRKARVLFVTFSSDTAYRLANGKDSEAGTVVANCHKEPASRFRVQSNCTAGLLEAWRILLLKLHEINPSLHAVFTLSPYRYAKYGLHESALEKARLLLFIDTLCTQLPDVASYFPAFEIITDELRDYRFYAADMLHPSEQAAAYVWERLRQWIFSPELSEYAQDRQAILRDLTHRPINPHSERWTLFVQKSEERRKRFVSKWGEDFQ